MREGVRVEGLRQTIRSLEALGVAVSDMKVAFRKIGNLVQSEARTLAPHKSGRLEASIRPSNAKNKAEIRAGGARVPYAGVQEFGGYNHITPHRFLRGAVEKEQGKAVQILDEELSRLVRKLDLNN